MAALTTGTYGQPAAEPDPYEYRILRIPRGTDIDGAVVQLHVSEDGSIVAMEIRIPTRDAAGDWTRDAMADSGTMTPMDSKRDLGPDGDLLEAAWGLIANAGEGDWTRESAEWQQAAVKWRERWHAWLDLHIHGDEDRIRDAMAEAHDHPGRTVTR